MPLEQGDYEINVAGDKLSATLVLKNAQIAGSFNLTDLKNILASKRVTSGINEAKLNDLVAKPVFNAPIQVAEGLPAIDGKDEEIKYYFPVGKAELEETETGAIDFKNIENFNNTGEGTVLAERTVPPPGTDGMNVHGEPIKAKKGRSAILRVGKGAELAEDGQQAVAVVSGHAALIADRITVTDTVEVPAHVDYSIGNINFIGNVRVRGGVMPGFKVMAEGNVEIANNVEKASIICGGNLNIRGIVFGQGDCTIQVGGDAEIAALDQANVEVHGNLKVHNYVTHCNLLVGGELLIEGKRGKLIGGETRAYRGIRVPFVGNNMATLTKLVVGSNPFISSELEKITAEMTVAEQKLDQVQNAIKATLAKKSAGQLPASAEAMLEKLKQAEPQLKAQVDQLAHLCESTKAKSADFKDAKIRVSEIVYSGVMISFRDKCQMKTMDETQRVTFYEEAAEIRTGPY